MKVDKTLSDEGAARFGLDLSRLKYLGGEDGDVYEGQDADEAFIFKLVPTDELGATPTLEKLAFAQYLADAGMRVARPLPSPQGAMIEIVRSGTVVIAATKAAKAPGRHPRTDNPQEWNDDLFARWGQVVGRMHALTKSYAGGAGIMHWHDEVAAMMAWCHDAEVSPHWENMRDHLAALPKDRVSYGLIHNDLHPYNFMVNQDEIVVFDFDVCGHHWFMTDIGIALFHALWMTPTERMTSREAFARQFLTAFIGGYEKENHLDDRWWKELPTFLAYRRLLLFTVFADSWGSADAPAWQQAWWRAQRAGIIADEPVVELDL
ncbi:MAG: phosphotransferase [Anaerolineae bacterium]|jgi:Ser/Thr protein kinase RdoA (MazF antagonist)|nr:phosphotransferase [Anaerolineae bacterium]